MISPFRGFNAIFYKEMLHMRRDPLTIMFALVVPLLQMTILGAAIDTNVRQVKTVVFDEAADQQTDKNLAGSEDRRAFLDRMRNSDTYNIYKYVHSDAELTEEMVAGRARVGLKFPWDFDNRLQKHETAQVMIMVDGSDSSVAGQTLNVATALGLDESLNRIIPVGTNIPIDVRPKVMFNPDSRSPNFFLPGLA